MNPMRLINHANTCALNREGLPTDCTCGAEYAALQEHLRACHRLLGLARGYMPGAPRVREDIDALLAIGIPEDSPPAQGNG